MKKSLLVAALIAGFAGAANAETSVTLYGIVDGGLEYQQVKGTNDEGESFKARKTGMGSGIQSTNRWGLKGTEDLGNGLQAVFVLENGFSLGDGTSDKMFGRQATIGLKSAAWGQVDFGRQTNIASKYLANVASPFGTEWGQATIGSAFTAANSLRYDNMIMYQTPNFAGFQFGLGYSFNASGPQEFKVSGGDEPNTRAWTTGVRYVNGPLAVAATYDQFKTASDGPDADENGVTVKSWNLAGSYNFEVVEVHAAFGQTRNGLFKPMQIADLETDALFADNGTKINSYALGLGAPVGASGKVLASWTMADPRHLGDGDGERQHVFSLGYTYALSKRTNVYALGSYAKNLYFADDLKATQFAVGLRHQF